MMTITNKNYSEFCETFDALVVLAKNDEKIFDYVYDLHNKITNGATKRIFTAGALPLAHLQVSQMNFERYITQNKNCSEIKHLLSTSKESA